MQGCSSDLHRTKQGELIALICWRELRLQYVEMRIKAQKQRVLVARIDANHTLRQDFTKLHGAQSKHASAQRREWYSGEKVP